jgi:hypothetical protein
MLRVGMRQGMNLKELPYIHRMADQFAVNWPDSCSKLSAAAVSREGT